MKANSENKRLYKDIRDEIERNHIVDAHNHLVSETRWLNTKEDWTSLLGYCVIDLVNAGLSRDKLLMANASDSRRKSDYGYDYHADTKSPEEKWKNIKPYWPYVRHMGSGDVTRTALKIFFDCDDLSDETVPTIQEKLDKLKRPGAYKEILQDKGKIDVVCDVSMSVKENPPTEVIAPQLYTDHFALIQNRRDIYRLEKEAGLDIYSFERYIKAIDVFLERSIKEEGAIGIKWHMFPYLRDMQYEISNPYDAAKCFDKILQMPARGGVGSFASVGLDEMRPFQNIVQNHLVQRAIELDVPVQIHAATLGSSYGGPLNGNPKALIQLFLRYPQARFNILHAAFPWSRELGAIAHMFPNVFINAAWLDILSPESYKCFMKDWLTGLPLNKIFAYGADQFTMLLTVACIERVKNMLAEVFTDLVSEGKMTEKEVHFAADCILRKNAWEHWKLADRKIP